MSCVFESQKRTSIHGKVLFSLISSQKNLHTLCYFGSASAWSMGMSKAIYIGTAAWTIPRDVKSDFSSIGSQLQQYSRKLNAVEINTSFYKDHKATTYQRWYSTVPAHFRFSVKLSKFFTHEQRLKKGEKNLAENLASIMNLKEKLGVLVVQLPPTLEFSPEATQLFFTELRSTYKGPIAFEPRHPTWNSPQACEIQIQHHISRVIADPAPLGNNKELAPVGGIIYYRLHGSPVMYKSNYQISRLQIYAREMQKYLKQAPQVWCIFDNTTYGHATSNALTLTRFINGAQPESHLYA